LRKALRQGVPHVLALGLLLAFVLPARAETVARCGQGWLERIDGYPVLHLKGTPYEIGYQHGALLKQDVRANLEYLVNVKGATPVKIGPLPLSPRAAIAAIVNLQARHVPPKYFDEMTALAVAAELDIDEVRMGNFIPELFHCSGFAVMNSATQDGTLYHGRVLDYAVDWQLQDHAVLIVCEPEGEIPFVNVSYAGFVGSVTGMNSRHVSIGEMGGGGLGHWDGMPMALLVREVLQTAGDLEAAISTMRDHPRTCQYFYVVADGNTNRAVGMEGSWDKFQVIEPGQGHPLLPHPVKDAVLLSADRRYEELVRRATAQHGHIDAQAALRLMDLPVALKSNLHDVLFAPKSTDLWVANASHDKQPAATQPYAHFNLDRLLASKPDPASPEIPLPPAAQNGRNRQPTPGNSD
jgi:isopenicillin-N N-acyltransferase like protein